MQGADSVLVDDRDRVRWIRLNRPRQLNALDRGMLGDLLAVLEHTDGDAGVGAVVITGSERGFCAGGDLQAGLHEVSGSGSIASQVGELRRFTRIVEVLCEMTQPVVACVNGPCAGAGLSLACAADIRLASGTATFSTGFIGAAVSGDFGGTLLLSNVVGPARARELYMTGRRLDALEALDLGLATEVYSRNELDRAAHDLAASLAAAAPRALTAIKQNFAALPAGLGHVLDVETRNHVACINTERAAAAEAAFRDRRAARSVHS